MGAAAGGKAPGASTKSVAEQFAAAATQKAAKASHREMIQDEEDSSPVSQGPTPQTTPQSARPVVPPAASSAPMSPTDVLKEISKKGHKELAAWLKIPPVGPDVARALKESQVTGSMVTEWYNSG